MRPGSRSGLDCGEFSEETYERNFQFHLPEVTEEFCFGTRVGGSKAQDVEQESPLHPTQTIEKDHGGECSDSTLGELYHGAP